MPITADSILARMGIDPRDPSSAVTEVRGLLEAKIAQGMTNHSGCSWADGAEQLTSEQRAQAYLDFDRAPRRTITTIDF